MNARQLLDHIQVEATRYYSWYVWTGPTNIRSYELHRLRRDLMLTCAEFRVARQEELEWPYKSARPFGRPE